MSAPKRFLARLVSDESGATAVEYGLMLVLVSVFVLGAVATVGGGLSTKFFNISNFLK